jgi:Domain of unknown function (DUF4192)
MPRQRPPDPAPSTDWPEPVAVRVRDAGEIAAGLPHLLGFHPRESVVLLSLGGKSGRRLGLTVRADIPPPEHNRSLAGALSRSLSTDRPDAALVFVVSEAADETFAGDRGLPHHDLVWEMCRALSRLDVPVADLVLVRDGRWWSYDCPDHCCAPGAGTPLPAEVTELEVASIATGTVVAGTRENLVARIAPPPEHDPKAMAAACARIGVELSGDLLDHGPEPAAAESWAAVMAGIVRCRPGAAENRRIPDEDVARIVWGLRDGEVRDLALELALGSDSAAAEQLWTECTRRAPAPLGAAPATLLAVSAWLRGDGAMANIALDRALSSTPGYGLATLLRDALAACMTPTDLRALLAAASDRTGTSPAAG